MKEKLFTYLLVLFFISCNGQAKKNNMPAKSIKNKTTQNNMFDINRFNKNKDIDRSYKYKDVGGNVVFEVENNADFYDRWEILPNNFYKTYSQYYHKTGVLAKTGTYFGGAYIDDVQHLTTKVGKWQYYDEKGILIKEENEEAKFGKFGHENLLKFLETEGLINTKTGEGKKFLNISYGVDTITKIVEERKENPWMPNKGEWSVIYSKTLPLNDHIYIINGESGKVISHRDIKGNELAK